MDIARSSHGWNVLVMTEPFIEFIGHSGGLRGPKSLRYDVGMSLTWGRIRGTATWGRLLDGDVVKKLVCEWWRCRSIDDLRYHVLDATNNLG